MTSSYFQKGISMSIKQKYLKDENGEIFSPIVSADSIYDSDGNAIPQIVAWCYAKISASNPNILAGKNISKIVLDTTKSKTLIVYFKEAIKDNNYAVVACAEIGGVGKEIVGIYEHSSTYFKLDVTDYQGINEFPTELNIIVVR